MAIKMVGVGSQYGVAAIDANGDYLDGGKTYRLTLPKDIVIARAILGFKPPRERDTHKKF